MAPTELIMPHWLEIFVTIFVSVMSSSGFWAWYQSRNERKDAKTQMLIGLGHDRIINKGIEILERGKWITEDEYDNLINYLYKPYQSLGGNGSAERIVNELKSLKIVKQPPKETEDEGRQSVTS